MEDIRCTGSQFADDLVCLVGGCPFLNGIALACVIAVGISFRCVQFQRCSCQFLFTGDLILGKRYLGGQVGHGEALQLAVCADNDGLISCNAVACRCRYFMQSICCTSRQLGGQGMCLSVCCPGIDFFSVLIQQLHFCSGKGKSVFCLLADFYLGGVIFHDDLRHSAVGVDCKFNVIGNHIAIGCCGFVQNVGLTGSQLGGDHMGFLAGSPAVQCIAAEVTHFQFCTFQFCVAGDRCLADLYLGRQIGQLDTGQTAVCVDGEFLIRSDAVAVRSGYFVQRVFCTGGQDRIHAMSCAVGCPLIDFCTSCVQKLQDCSGQRLAVLVNLVDADLGCNVLHGDVLHLTVRTDGKLLICCLGVPLGSRCFSEDICLTGNQFAVDLMHTAVCDPAVHQCFFSVCVCCDDLQGSTAQRFAVFIDFLDLDFCCKVVHPDPHFAGFVIVTLDKFALVVQGEVNILCHTVTVRCRHFVEGVGFARCQYLADLVLCVFRCPFVQDVSVFVDDLKLCSRQEDEVLSSRLLLDIRKLSDGQTSLFHIFHDNTVTSFEFDVLGKEISLRCGHLVENVGFVRIQNGSQFMACAVCGPFFNDCTSRILDLQDSTDHVVTFIICLKDTSPCSIVHHANGYGILAHGKFHILCGVVAGGGCCFVEGVCLSVDQFSVNYMSSAVCDPFLNHVFVAVQDLHLCTAQRFFAVVILADLDLCSVVYHLQCDGIAVQIGHAAVSLNGKVDGICLDVTVRCSGFPVLILLSNRQLCSHDVAAAVCCPGIYGRGAAQFHDRHLRTGKGIAVLVNLGKFHSCRVIDNIFAQLDFFICLVDFNCNRITLIREDIAVRRGDLVYHILAVGYVLKSKRTIITGNRSHTGIGVFQRKFCGIRRKQSENCSGKSVAVLVYLLSDDVAGVCSIDQRSGTVVCNTAGNAETSGDQFVSGIVLAAEFL